MMRCDGVCAASRYDTANIVTRELTIVLAVEVGVVIICLIVLTITVLKRRNDQGGLHRDSQAVHRVGSSVEDLRAREGAHYMRYYPQRDR